jgi:hypothetical protein
MLAKINFRLEKILACIYIEVQTIIRCSIISFMR